MSKNFTVIPGLLPRHGRPRPAISTVIPGPDRGSLCEQVGGQAILPCDGLFGC